MENITHSNILHYNDPAFKEMDDDQRKVHLLYWRANYGVKDIIETWRGNRDKYYAEAKRLELPPVDSANRLTARRRAEALQRISGNISPENPEPQPSVDPKQTGNDPTVVKDLQDLLKSHGADNMKEARELVKKDQEKIEEELYEELTELGLKIGNSGTASGSEIASDLRNIAQLIESGDRTFSFVLQINQVMLYTPKRTVKP